MARRAGLASRGCSRRLRMPLTRTHAAAPCARWPRAACACSEHDSAAQSSTQCIVVQPAPALHTGACTLRAHPRHAHSPGRVESVAAQRRPRCYRLDGRTTRSSGRACVRRTPSVPAATLRQTLRTLHALWDAMRAVEPRTRPGTSHAPCERARSAGRRARCGNSRQLRADWGSVGHAAERELCSWVVRCAPVACSLPSMSWALAQLLTHSHSPVAEVSPVAGMNTVPRPACMRMQAFRLARAAGSGSRGIGLRCA